MRPRTFGPFVVTLLVIVQAALGTPANAAVPVWTTYRHDPARSGIDPDSASPVTPSQAWQTPALDGEVYGQPLVYGPYVYVATENDTVYKLDAASGAVVWSKHLATPEPSSMAPCGDITPSIGITSTPVIDQSTGRIYAVGATSDGVHATSVQHELFALDLGSGQPAAGFPISVDPPFPTGGKPVNQLQRPGLALDSGRILIGYGGNDGDCATYWGWLVSAPESGAGAQGVFQVDAGSGHHAGAIWAGGNAPLLDAAGSAFVATGNGIGNSSANPEYGDSVVRLNASAAPQDWWAPLDWQALDSSDADLGSSMPTLLPGGWLFQAGKDSNGYILNGANLGHITAAPAGTIGFCGAGSFGGSVYDPGNATIYAACGDGLRALSLGSGSPPSLTPKPGFSAPGGSSGPPMIAGGLVWVTDGGGGTLYGLDPSTGTTRSHFSIPETGSDVNHFATPSAGGGRLFVGSGDQVTAFTIAQPPPLTATATALSTSSNPAAPGVTVTLTAAVSPTPYAGAVTFTDAGAAISGCSGIPVSAVSGGRAVCEAAFGATGTHKLAAAYSGDGYYSASGSPVLDQSITRGPIISSAFIRPRRFTSKHGSKLKLMLNESATLAVAVTQLHHGHISGNRCSAKARAGKRCSVRVTLNRLRFAAGAGRNSFKLKLRGLPPGNYTALIYATDRAGRVSRTVRITFTILRPHHS